ncbi:FRG domain-containing protein [Pseudolysobacter antarcticus]|uniref:FRG domain-containing protein n=1 Tax=Pseudolysobacter antarcticus TaxID=2511995 RepID=A0A411HK70_9GAMM|nr:FRG domain-containing protein [Pseudolysobacter antarcticus]QBB70936.1 FRG domain-containing protein [Pseudolysobacter antarcticus]
MAQEKFNPWHGSVASSIAEFHDRISMMAPRCNDRMLFRGQGVIANPLPRFHRMGVVKDGLPELEKLQIREFLARFSRGYAKDSESQAEWKILALLQHFGGFTRLLDWSHDCLVALWFAVESRRRDAHKDDEHAAVWVVIPLETDWVNSDDLTTNSPCKIDTVKFVEPYDVDMRVVSQGSFLSVHPFPRSPMDILTGFTSHWEKLRKLGRMFQIQIPAEFLDSVLKELVQLGIDKVSIYPERRPDIEHYVQMFNSQYSDAPEVIFETISKSVHVS